jgi:hypothetical protein
MKEVKLFSVSAVLLKGMSTYLYSDFMESTDETTARSQVYEELQKKHPSYKIMYDNIKVSEIPHLELVKYMRKVGLAGIGRISEEDS